MLQSWPLQDLPASDPRELVNVNLLGKSVFEDVINSLEMRYLDCLGGPQAQWQRFLKEKGRGRPESKRRPG